MNKDSKIFIAGHRGLVGSAIVRALEKKGYYNLLKASHKELDLTVQHDVLEFFKTNSPEFVFDAAAKVGGIHANNSFPADFIYNNLTIQNNLIDASYHCGVKKFLFLGSSCIYPKMSPQPIKEQYLLTGSLEPTNEWYAIAKIAGIKMCQAYNKQHGFNTISLMPTNLYGPGDNFDIETSHVLPALIRKFHEAKEQNRDSVKVWGTGAPMREFLHVDDFADAAIFLMQQYNDPEIINIGTGKDISIDQLAKLVKQIVGFEGKIIFDHSKPDGTLKKLLDVSRINNLGWQAKISLKQGITDTYEWYKNSLLGKKRNVNCESNA